MKVEEKDSAVRGLLFAHWQLGHASLSGTLRRSFVLFDGNNTRKMTIVMYECNANFQD